MELLHARPRRRRGGGRAARRSSPASTWRWSAASTAKHLPDLVRKGARADGGRRRGGPARSCGSRSGPGSSSDPYVDPRGADGAPDGASRARSRRGAAARSIVLLRNEGGAAAARARTCATVAVVGPLADDAQGDDRHLGAATAGRGRGHRPGRNPARAGQRDARRPREGLRDRGRRATRASPRRWTPRRARTRSCWWSARSRSMSGEAASRSIVDLPGPADRAGARGARGRQADRGRAGERPAADDSRGSPSTCRRGPDGLARRDARPATPSPTCCSATSTRAASCPSRSRAPSARCRSTTRTRTRAGRRTPSQKYTSKYLDVPSRRSSRSATA